MYETRVYMVDGRYFDTKSSISKVRERVFLDRKWSVEFTDSEGQTRVINPLHVSQLIRLK